MSTARFIWEYQQHFRITLQGFADRLFLKLDQNLKPKVFIFGLEQGAAETVIRLEPEDCGYKSSDFSNLNELAHQLAQVDSDPEYPELARSRALKAALLKIIEREARLADVQTYASGPVSKDGHTVFVVLQLSRTALEAHYRLLKTAQPASLVEATVQVFLSLAEGGLFMPKSGNLADARFEGDELIQLAGKRLMSAVAGQCSPQPGDLFEACNIISSLKYEGEDCVGGLILAARNHPSLKLNLVLDSPINLGEYRKVRKLLELSDSETFLISDASQIYGLGQLNGRYNPGAEDLFMISFVKHYHWEIGHAENCLMRVAYNQPYLPKNRINRDVFHSNLKRIFRDIKPGEIDTLWTLVAEAINQKHGTLLAITSGAHQEAQRLRNQGFPVEPTRLSEDLIAKITGIDGAVLLAPDGTCHAIGVILDGIASAHGDAARGARYNSATRYYDFIRDKYACLLIVVSEDGMVDILPYLMPQISRASLNERLRHLNEMNEARRVKIKDFNYTMEWLEQHSFYLSTEQCAQVNSLRASLEDKIERQTSGAYLKLSRRDLKPNPEMNASYFL